MFSHLLISFTVLHYNYQNIQANFSKRIYHNSIYLDPHLQKELVSMTDVEIFIKQGGSQFLIKYGLLQQFDNNILILWKQIPIKQSLNKASYLPNKFNKNNQARHLHMHLQLSKKRIIAWLRKRNQTRAEATVVKIQRKCAEYAL
ncbi:hypothetical protein FGO68_gene12877 [Halteria grandinella]|uniref:Uncharacterized protein n=1 Tax=Halteria grandinella TaxID=5974 RepID=A0A8J8P2W8_HALGN|nr:hypothetical protein FGO68_gene12877 [Halteria grandinella]